MSSTIGGCRTELTGGYLDLTGAVLTCGCHSRMRRRGIGRSTTAREEEEGMVEGPGDSSSGTAQPASLGNRREERGSAELEVGRRGVPLCGRCGRAFWYFFCGVGSAM